VALAWQPRAEQMAGPSTRSGCGSLTVLLQHR
jgi:hypothetical protein